MSLTLLRKRRSLQEFDLFLKDFSHSVERVVEEFVGVLLQRRFEHLFDHNNRSILSSFHPFVLSSFHPFILSSFHPPRTIFLAKHDEKVPRLDDPAALLVGVDGGKEVRKL